MNHKFVNKSWGYEIWFANYENEDISYCGKEIFVEHNKWSSKGAFHYHQKKDETFFVIDGFLLLEYVEGKANFNSIVLNKGETFRVRPYTKHRFTSAGLHGCRFIEVSSFHRDFDSYRCEWNPEGGEWILELENKKVEG